MYASSSQCVSAFGWRDSCIPWSKYQPDCYNTRVNGEQCSELPTTSERTMWTDCVGPWSSRSMEGVEIHGPYADRPPSVWSVSRRLYLKISESYIANYWSSPIVGGP